MIQPPFFGMNYSFLDIYIRLISFYNDFAYLDNRYDLKRE